ncbi:PTS lactose/cellobiose transporter subunit IIA [Calorimonas adulescens]|uniref:PTS lactose/cellobiose transporter subunit IIA n=1 Tax=Calorimonas adulescens TaxID=2606906 RepID=A0A5D8QA65_9THEO|nr:PTS lactose/cellobiose transporter subunit IIA [Calorimonas adulescens]TZE81287.1 PTS lactose/cellobiose transporter subunit IIA [Calorimonas adulescens]
MDFEQIVFEIIVHAGNARSDAFEALASAREGNFNEAYKLIDKVKEELQKAHEIQNNLISLEAEGEHIQPNLLLVHAEDHLMNAILAKDLIIELIHLYEDNQKCMVKK